eukprot:scaffold133722_cov26-Tisochrysis_lutea.AAC.2
MQIVFSPRVDTRCPVTIAARRGGMDEALVRRPSLQLPPISSAPPRFWDRLSRAPFESSCCLRTKRKQSWWDIERYVAPETSASVTLLEPRAMG